MLQNIYKKLNYKYFGKIISFVAVGAFVLLAAQPMFVSATPVTIFSDNFDQGGSVMTNGWDNFSETSNPVRDDVDGSFTVRAGSSGKGMLLGGGDNFGPNEQAGDP